MKGAAVAAVKSLAPQLIKIAVGIILFVLILIIIIFLALPSFLFKWTSLELPALEGISEQATVSEMLYKNVESYARKEGDKIAEELSYGYDDAEINIDLGGVSRNRLISIGSVMQSQNLGEMDEQMLRGLIRKNLDYSCETEDYEEDSGLKDIKGNAITETKTKIIIDIWTITPDALMDKLGFDDFQKMWVAFMYGNINDTQLVDPADPDYPGGELINYGDLVYTDGGRDVNYYNQTDERWGSEMYGTLHTIATAGCGPTALAMVVSSMTGIETDPKAMAGWAVENGHCCDGNGSHHSLIPEGAAHFGLNVEGAGPKDGQKIINALAEGKLVVALMGAGHFTTCGHFIVLRGVTAEGKILVADPVSMRKSGMEWDTRIIFGEASGRAVAGGPFWILSL